MLIRTHDGEIHKGKVILFQLVGVLCFERRTCVSPAVMLARWGTPLQKVEIDEYWDK